MEHGRLCLWGALLRDAPARRVCRRLFVCQVSREFVSRHCCVCSFLPCLGSSGCVCICWLELRQAGLTPPSICIWIFGQLRLHKPVASLLWELTSGAGWRVEGEVQAEISGC